VTAVTVLQTKRTYSKTISIVIGHYPDVRINDARAIVSEHLQDLLHGIDVAERIKLNRDELLKRCSAIRQKNFYLNESA